jgi:pimeloyl-ACP methyl ester carboxylesterase
MKALKIPKAHFAGWSTGGGVILNFTVLYPEKSQSLTFFGSVSVKGFKFLS